MDEGVVFFLLFVGLRVSNLCYCYVSGLRVVFFMVFDVAQVNAQVIWCHSWHFMCSVRKEYFRNIKKSKKMTCSCAKFSDFSDQLVTIKLKHCGNCCRVQWCFRSKQIMQLSFYSNLRLCLKWLTRRDARKATSQNHVTRFWARWVSSAVQRV